MSFPKKTVTCEVSSTSVEALPGLLIEIAEHLKNTYEAGYLSHDDGDSLEWSTKSIEANHTKYNIEIDYQHKPLK